MEFFLKRLVCKVERPAWAALSSGPCPYPLLSGKQPNSSKYESWITTLFFKTHWKEKAEKEGSFDFFVSKKENIQLRKYREGLEAQEP